VEAGKQVVRVNPHNTSQICSGCGALVKKGLSVRIHQFPHCGLNIDRDINAARNILQLALRQAAKNTYRLGRGLRGWSRSSRLDEPRSPGINSKVISHQF
jgi:transposase